MCILIRLIVLLLLCPALPCVAQCEPDESLHVNSGCEPMARHIETALSLSITTRKRWRLNIGWLSAYRTDEKLPQGMRTEKSDRFRQAFETTRLLHLEKSF